MANQLPAGIADEVFAKCKLDFSEREKNNHIYQLHRDLIKLRKEDPVFKAMQRNFYDGAVLGNDAFLLRYFNERERDRLLLINFGVDYYFNPAPEPLLAPGKDEEWETLFSTESVVYGGTGTPPICNPYWNILGHSATVLRIKPK